ncbi:AMP-dependent synthetase [Streptomyces agglomeratus]|uniref:AMP-dependent synthetase n=1 Tax=Streptomyces agglomeratus TaxID=285458 RepID=A0A1E5PFG9_9ACTN|nr:AMP-binding protein [Streptomyces agglomeratus]OEJ28124.1 AMP-dependent synthetase [Streptomyces agglomeratus]
MKAPSGLLPGTKNVPFADALAAHGDRTAVITADGRVSYRELAVRVDATARRLGPERRLVLLVAANTVDALVVHLAALAGGHPVLLVPGDHPEAVRSLTDAYDPDVVARPDGDGWVLDERRDISAHTLHPDLALLLSTSGSTGSPKLVRLSHQNVQANAESIAEYLDIRDTDRAATTLPMHYCYGLSVLHSHLLRGAAVILTGLSVTDACFWELFCDARGTTFAGVPYTFELLDRVGFDAMELPHLRYVTQAGGRLAPARVARYAALGRAAGWDLFVMYGQTEATARMAYLPPEFAHTRPEAAGIAVPGGSFRLQPLPDWPGESTGELVYTGPNVMLGYAEGPEDLALGRTVDELHTGDIARLAPDGLYELVGRRSRFAKILGLRIDPQQVEAMLEKHGVTACCTGDDDELVVAVLGDPEAADPNGVRRLVTAECGLPPRAVRVRVLAELPRLATGKADYRAIRELAGPAPAPPAAPAEATASEPAAAALCRLYARILDRDAVTEDSSFVGLGGDSLSYVEMSLHLEEVLGELPDHWHTLPIRELREPSGRPADKRRGSRRRTLETSVALRAVAIVLIVGSHIHLFWVKGGAHVLLGVAGYNFARFHLGCADRRERLRNIGRSVARIAVPSMAWLALMLLVTDDYDLTGVLLLTSLLGPNDGFWFIEVLLYMLVAVAALLAVPWVDRAERRFPFALPAALAVLGLIGRYDLFGLEARVHVPLVVTVFWLFALGWTAARASTVGQRLLVNAAVLATVPGFFPGELAREVVVVVGLTLLIWVRTVPSVAWVNRVAGVLAGSSLYIYVTHWQVFPRLEGMPTLVATLASLLVGIAYAALATRVMRWRPSLPGSRGTAARARVSARRGD